MNMGLRRRTQSPSPMPGLDPLAERVADLELRLRLLEARLRQVTGPSAHSEARNPRGSNEQKPRPRCPGCLLELPKGRRGESCVWCGFVFDALGKRAAK
jgi:hypothetical protein